MAEVTIELTGANRIAIVRLNRPERLNAFTPSMARELSAAYTQLDADDRIRVIVLTGTGRAFCSGADLGAGDGTFASPSTGGFTASPVTPAFDLGTPVIAAVNGHAIGIGLTLALHADVRIVALEGKYAIPQVRLGMVPDAVSHWTLPRLVGASIAAELMLSGRRFDGADAQRWGLASRALPGDQVLGSALELADEIATYSSPRSTRLSKRILWESLVNGHGPHQVEVAETQAHLELMGSRDATEGVAAFLDQRPPRWD